MKRLLVIMFALLLGACSSDQEDIEAWMHEQEKGMAGSVKPLPEIRPYVAAKYDVAPGLDPFQAVRIEPEAKTAVRGGPDLDRRREPLEAFPLESLQLVGVMTQNKKVHALVRADKNLYQVRVGNYVGQNFGLVTAISDSDVTVKELVEDLNGEWVERNSKLLLQEAKK